MSVAIPSIKHLRKKRSQSFLALDTEWDEMNCKELLQVGLTEYDASTCRLETVLYIVSENFEKENSKYLVTDKFSFSGKSLVMPKSDILRLVKKRVDRSPLLVGVNMKQDLRILGCGNIIDFNKMNVDVLYKEACHLGLIEDKVNKNKVGLSRMVRQLHPELNLILHNAANDSLATALCFFSLRQEVSLAGLLN